MKVMIDTNIVFGGLLNTNPLIGKLLFYPGGDFTFCSCGSVKEKISQYWDTLKHISGLHLLFE